MSTYITSRNENEQRGPATNCSMPEEQHTLHSLQSVAERRRLGNGQIDCAECADLCLVTQIANHRNLQSVHSLCGVLLNLYLCCLLLVLCVCAQLLYDFECEVIESEKEVPTQDAMETMQSPSVGGDMDMSNTSASIMYRCAHRMQGI